MPKPEIISAQVAGSGTAPAPSLVTEILSKKTPPLPPLPAARVIVVGEPVPVKEKPPVFQTIACPEPNEPSLGATTSKVWPPAETVASAGSGAPATLRP